jgi:hypothetical protein
MIGDGQKKLAKDARLEMRQKRGCGRLLARTRDEIRKLRLSAPRIRYGRRCRQTVDQGLGLLGHGRSIGCFRRSRVFTRI